ncbi:hypothetical protein D3C81_1375960 [compost metagenome]
MAPAAVTGGGLEVDVVVVAVGFGAFVVQGQVDVTLPGQVLDHRLWFHDLLDAGQLDRPGCLAVGQSDLTVVRSVQRLGLLAGVGVLLDQQFLVAFQGLDLLPVQCNGAAIGRFEQQFTAIKDLDLAAQLVTVFHPHGIGKGWGTGSGQGNAQQGSRRHKQQRTRVREKSRALSRYPPSEQGLTCTMSMSSILICPLYPAHPAWSGSIAR